jgi:hypothetical protein
VLETPGVVSTPLPGAAGMKTSVVALPLGGAGRFCGTFDMLPPENN